MTAVQNTPGGQSGGPMLVGAHTDGSSGRSGTPAERFTSTDWARRTVAVHARPPAAVDVAFAR
jgi:hypothetical protein